jgi:hypothetical protein
MPVAEQGLGHRSTQPGGGTGDEDACHVPPSAARYAAGATVSRLHDSGAAWDSIRSGDIGAIGMPVTDGATIVIYSQPDARGFGPADGH